MVELSVAEKFMMGSWHWVKFMVELLLESWEDRGRFFYFILWEEHLTLGLK
jgi:hypothetical protein